MIDEDAGDIEDLTPTPPWGDEDAAAPPAFKPLPEHWRANSRQADWPRATPWQGAQPGTIPRPLDPAPVRLPEPEPPRVRRRRGRLVRGVALLLAGAAIGAAALHVAGGDPQADDRPAVAPRYYTTLPPAVPAAPPPEILYVDKWRIVAIDPPSLAGSAPATPATPKSGLKPLGMFAPAMPIAPPPRIVLLERVSQPLPGRKRAAPETKPASLSAPTPSQPVAPGGQTDIVQEMKQWLSPSPHPR